MGHKNARFSTAEHSNYKRISAVHANENLYATIIMHSVKVLSYGLMCAAFVVIMFAFGDRLSIGDGKIFESCLKECGMYFVIVLLLNRIYGGFDFGKRRIFEVLFSQSLAQLLSLILIYFIDILPLFRYVSLVPYLMVLVIQLPVSVVICYCANKLFFRVFKPLKTLIICDSMEEVTTLESIRFFDEHFDVGHVILYRKQNITQLLSEMDGYNALFIGNVADDLRKKLLTEAVYRNIEGYVLPTISDVLIGGSEQTDLFGMLVIKIGRNHIRPEYFFFKRFFDIVISFIGLIVFCPLMIVIAIAVKLCDGGSVFYKQTRLTQYGRPFLMLKFRSMCPDAEEKTGAHLAIQNDSRITAVGRVIRACRLDELPQLINILKGDMTFVGPRPERPEIAAEYEKTLPEFRLRLQMKAGLTGLAQVCGKYSTDPEAKLKMDLIYANRMSFYEDVRLILATLKIIFMSENAEGIQAEQSTSESVREKEAG